ncbi:MAG: hypothetical protein EON47_06310, partial [Acetobacteraceae bacterium]
ANACIDRGSQGDTVIGPGSRLDNLTQIGHNVTMGRGCIIVALAGISGSSTLGDYVQLAAQAGIAGHLEIGSPAWPVREFWRSIARLRKMGAPPSKPDIKPDTKDEGKAG